MKYFKRQTLYTESDDKRLQSINDSETELVKLVQLWTQLSSISPHPLLKVTRKPTLDYHVKFERLCVIRKHWQVYKNEFVFWYRPVYPIVRPGTVTGTLPATVWYAVHVPCQGSDPRHEVHDGGGRPRSLARKRVVKLKKKKKRFNRMPLPRAYIRIV